MLRCKIFLILLISGLLIFGPAKGFASPEEMQILVNTLVEKGQLTQDEADAVMTAIKKHIPQQEKTRVETGKLPAVTTVTAQAAKKLDISGYVDARYDIKTASTSSGKTDDMYINHAVVNFKGTVTDNVLFQLDLDFAKAFNNKTTTGTTNYNSLLNETFIKFTYFPSANITFGQFKVPFAQEYIKIKSSRDFIESPVVLKNSVTNPYNSATNLDLADELDRGLMVDANLLDNRLYYAFAVINGAGQNTSDDNDNKDVAGKLILSPFAAQKDSPLAEFKIGAAYQDGVEGDPKCGYEYYRTRTEGLLMYTYKNFKFQGEYVTQDMTPSISLGSLKKISPGGWYVHAGYNFPLQNEMSIQPLLGLESFDPNTNPGADLQTITTVGLNYYLNKNTKLSVDYRIKKDKNPANVNADTNCNDVLTQIQFKF
jgi:phosphate-selective porin